MLPAARASPPPIATGVNQGNEGIDIKDGSVDNIIEDNDVYMQLDENSGGAFETTRIAYFKIVLFPSTTIKTLQYFVCV